MILTTEQREAIRHDDNTLLVACPGSGKTRTIIARLLRSLSQLHDTPRRVACITYTNAAVHEIEQRLRIYGSANDEERCDISTIHTFCLNSVLRQHHWRIPKYKKGFTVLPSESDEFRETAYRVISKYGMNRDHMEAFELLGRRPDGKPISNVIQDAAAQEFWTLLEDAGYIDFTNIVFWTYKLLERFPHLAAGLSSRYSWILVDEFQDTSSLQVEILERIAEHGRSRFFLVGDPHQSIFGFAGADPSLMFDFSESIGAKSDFILTGNFRSSKPITRHADRFLKRKRPMVALGPSRDYADEPEQKHGTSAWDVISGVFLPKLEELKIPCGEAAILAPSWFPLLPLARSLREAGIPVVGPGARPYKRGHLVALFAENLSSHLEAPTARQFRVLQRELYFLVQALMGESPLKLLGFEGRVVLINALVEIRESYDSNIPAIPWLMNVAESVGKILHESGIISQRAKSTLKDSVVDMREDIVKRGTEVDSLHPSDLAMFANPQNSLKLLTIHRSKGREFDAVAVVDVHERTLPNWRANDDPSAMAEARRLFYVAITRPRRLLLYVTDSKNPRNAPSRFLSELFS